MRTKTCEALPVHLFARPPVSPLPGQSYQMGIKSMEQWLMKMLSIRLIGRHGHPLAHRRVHPLQFQSNFVDFGRFEAVYNPPHVTL